MRSGSVFKRRDPVSRRGESTIADVIAIAILGIAVLFLTGGVFAQDARVADPTQPPSQRAGEGSASGGRAPLRVEGIVVSGTRRLVMIAGEFLTEGDSIFGLRVERIEQHAVTLRDATRTLVLSPQTALPESAAFAGDPQ